MKCRCRFEECGMWNVEFRIRPRVKTLFALLVILLANSGLAGEPLKLEMVGVERIWDKALHFGVYAALGLLFVRAFRGEGTGWIAAAALALLATSAYGASDEWHQLFTPGRQSGLDDWIARGREARGQAPGRAPPAGSLRPAFPRPLSQRLLSKALNPGISG